MYPEKEMEVFVMKKRKVMKLLSCVIAFSMAMTAAPSTALAAEIPVVTWDDLEMPGIAERAILEDGVNDAWAQDEATVLGEGSVNEKTEDGWLHLKSGSGNGNSAGDSSQYPAMFVNPKTFDFSQEGYFEFTMSSVSARTDTRFGVYLGYQNPGEGMFLGYDAGGWFWQKYTGGDGDYYGGTRVAAPEADVQAKVKIMWTADKKFTLIVNETTVFENETCDLDLSSGKIAFKLSTRGDACTEVKVKDIHYTGQAAAESHQVTGKVVNERGEAVEGASVTIGGQTVTTGSDGTYTFAEMGLGTYTITVTSDDYGTGYGSVTVEHEDAAAGDITLPEKPAVPSRTLRTADMDVQVAENFPSVIQYDMKGNLAGKTFLGQTEELNTIKINGISIAVSEEDVEKTFTDTKAVYKMTLRGENAPANEKVDCVITAEISVDKNTASFDITKVENKLTEKDENGYEVYPVQTIEIPNHSLISVRSSQANANLKAAKMSSNTMISGDKYFEVTKNMSAVNEDFMYGFVSNDEMSAGLWSNSEYQGTHVASYITAGGASNTRVMATTSTVDGEKSVGLASTAWFYDRKITPVVNGTRRTYVVPHEIMPGAKVVITGDENKDGDIDWQDGAVAFRDIMHNPQGCEVVPELVNYRIAMNFGSMAANPFLTNLDGVKRVYLNTDGLGQGVLLKGYGSEGHDSGHPDYGDIGRRIGGAQDMNTLLTEGKKMGALFGVHVNASEMYAEAKAFDDELSRGDAGINSGWNWLDQGVGINSAYDLASGRREARFQELYDQVGNNLDFIYVDVWGNGVSGEGEDAWYSRMLAREINGFGWRLATEWGPTQEYDSTLQHWAADLGYGDYDSKGENSEVMRFLRNHQKDSWIADYPRYSGAAQAPLLGGLNMTDFEGWQGRTDFKNYITIMFRHNLITKYLQHYQVVDWVDGTPVSMARGSWTPEMQITLRNTKSDTDKTEIVVSRDSNDYSNLSQYRSRTIQVNGVTVSTGAPTGGDGSNRGNEKYLIPWNWDASGEPLKDADKKMYHWNTQGGTSTWTLTKEWEGLSSVVVYELTDEGKTNMQTVSVVNNQITLTDMKAETPYVIYKGEKAPLTVDWQTSKYVYDMGYNDTDVNSHRTVSGTGTAEIVDNVSQNNMLKLTGDVSVSTQLTNLEAGKKYALYIGVDNRSDAKAHMTVTDGDKTLGTNYATRSFVQNIVSSDQHHTGSGATGDTANDRVSYFQNMFVFFTAEHDTATLTLKRDAGEGSTYFDDVRVVETGMDVVKATDEEGNITELYNDFEENAQGIWPFVVSGPGGITDNRIHLSERHDPYTQAGYNVKAVDDVLDGDWSVKINALVQNNAMIYQTIPQNFRFEPGETYYVSFDYQMGSMGTYEIRIGDGTNNNVKSVKMPANPGNTLNFGFSFTASESGDSWFGIYSTGEGADSHGLKGNMFSFAGYADFILDNVKIQKTSMTMDTTYTEVTTAKDKISLSTGFNNPADEGTEVVWESSDESVARVDQEGNVYFVGFGSAMITASSTVGGKTTTLSSTVYFPNQYVNPATFERAWANTQETSSENSGAANVLDRSADTIWHSQYSGSGFTVSESNPAIITVQLAEDVSEFETKAFLQRSQNNGLVQKYECIVGDSFDPSTHTIGGTDGVNRFTTGTVNVKAEQNAVEVLELPEGTKGHYLQIRVLQGYGNFASIADILIDTTISYDTPEERGYMTANGQLLDQKEEEAREKAKKALADAVKAADVVYAQGQGNNTDANWKAFTDAYEAAKAAKPDASAVELARLRAALVAAQEALTSGGTVPADELAQAQKELKAALAAAEGVYAQGKKDYTDASWKAFADAYAAAKAAENSKDAAAVKKAAGTLAAAQKALVTGSAVPPNGAIGDTKLGRYQVISGKNRTAKLLSVKKKKATKLNVPATVKISGVTFKVVEVGAKVMKGNTKLKKIVLGVNVATIGKQAFQGCKNLKTVQLKGKALKRIKSGAFKKTSAKLTVSAKKMKKSQKAALLKKLKKAGSSKKAKVK